jgi:hypothetical protein
MAVKERPDRRAQPQLVQSGGAQLGDDRAQVRDLPLNVLDGLVHRRLGPLEIVAAPRGGEQHAQAPEALQGLVVKLPCPASALGVRGGLGAAQPIALHALRERHGGRGACRECAQYLLSSSLNTLPSTPRSNAARMPTPSPR